MLKRVQMYRVVISRTYKIMQICFLSRAPSCREKKVAISVRNPILGLILSILGKNTALRTPRTPNSGMENPNLRKEFLFYVDLYVNQR
jgi:hypothetical protein